MTDKIEVLYQAIVAWDEGGGKRSRRELARRIDALLREAAQPECWCEACRPVTFEDMRMPLCPVCGNKRCPRSLDHRNACNNSNATDQVAHPCCNNPAQCWEPCGDLGKSAEHARSEPAWDGTFDGAPKPDYDTTTSTHSEAAKPRSREAAKPEQAETWREEQVLADLRQLDQNDETMADRRDVDRFSFQMKRKLALAAMKGRGGWRECDPAVLSKMLRDHVEKGDPRDVANFCMFLWVLGSPIHASPSEEELRRDAERLDWMMRNVSGKELREMGILTFDGCTRELIDAAIDATAREES